MIEYCIRTVSAGESIDVKVLQELGAAGWRFAFQHETAKSVWQAVPSARMHVDTLRFVQLVFWRERQE